MAATLLLLAQCTLGFAAHAGDSVEKLLNLSGAYKAVDSLPDALKGGLQQGKANMPPAVFEKMVSSVDDFITPAAIKKPLNAEVKKALSEKEVTELLVWYSSDLGQEMVAAEAKSATVEGYAQMQQQAQKLFADAPRVEMAKNYDVLIGATDAMIDMQVSSTAAMYSAMATISNPGVPADLSKFKSMIAPQMAPMRSQMESMIIMSFVYAHQATDMDKLKKYETFLNTPTAIKFNKVAMKAMLGGFEQTVVQWAGKLPQVVKAAATATAK